MHTYDIDSAERTKTVILFACFGIAAAYAVNLLSDRAGMDAWWIEVPGPLAATGILYWWFERWGWKIGWLHSLSAISTPVLAGEWHGTLWSSFDGPLGQDSGEEREFHITIRQTWTSIVITARSPKSRSASKSAAIRVNDGPSAVIVYTYLNEPSADAVETMSINYGTAVHEFDAQQGTLNGHYYTGRGRMTWGKIALSRRSTRV